ncbi:MAG: glycosyltransferase [Acidimicrobiia bacterium]
MRILFFGTFDKEAHPRVQVLEEGFEDLGDQVVECNVPLGVDTGARVKIMRQPWLAPVLAFHIARTWLRLWRSARRLEPPEVVIVGYLGQFDVHLARWLWRQVPVVLDLLTSASATARDRRAALRGLVSALELVDRAAIAASDVVLVDTAENLDLLSPPRRVQGEVVPVGAPRAWFREPDTKDGPLAVIFFGLYTPLQGAPVIGRAIELLQGDDITFTMIGHGQDLEATKEAAGDSKSIRWMDWVPSVDLPTLTAQHMICLGIFGTTPKAYRVVPNKVYQGAAAGCAVITSDTHPQRRALENAALFVRPGDHEQLAESLRLLAGDPDRLTRLRVAARQRAEEAFRPEVVVEPLRTRLLTTNRSDRHDRRLRFGPGSDVA